MLPASRSGLPDRRDDKHSGVRLPCCLREVARDMVCAEARVVLLEIQTWLRDHSDVDDHEHGDHHHHKDVVEHEHGDHHDHNGIDEHEHGHGNSHTHGHDHRDVDADDHDGAASQRLL